ncbi:MAG: 5-formyltetrahydrofolate cyclo-ligase [Alphaproteobacteria bacterium]|nr:5-formyltetrahydrofolate cyclo-ligase [Alphaproteobacteria bacterium]
MDKPALRQEMRKNLAALSGPEAEMFDAQIASYFLKTQKFMPQSIICLYMPLKGEVSCRSIIQTLTAQGHTTCLPAVVARDTPLAFRLYKPGDKLERGIMGPMEPAHSAREVVPDVIVIPMLGFTRGRYRLGYGTGFYDRSIEALRKTKSIKTVGLAYSLQEMVDFPVEIHDIPLDAVITEKEVIT